MKKKTLWITVLLLLFCFVFCSCQDGGTFTPLDGQVEIFTELSGKTADVGFMDYTLASYMLSLKTDTTKDLMIIEGLDLGEHASFAVSGRKCEDGKYNLLMDKINLGLQAVQQSGKYASLCADYGLTAMSHDLSYETPVGKTADTTEWDRVVENGSIIVGFNTAPPMSMTKQEGSENVEDGGFAKELCDEVFRWINETEKTDIEIVYHWIEFDNYTAEFESKKMDIFWSDMSYTEERAEKLDFSTKFIQNRTCAVIRKEDKDVYTDIESMKNARLVAEKSGVGSDVARQILGIE